MFSEAALTFFETTRNMTKILVVRMTIFGFFFFFRWMFSFCYRHFELQIPFAQAGITIKSKEDILVSFLAKSAANFEWF